MRIRSRAWPSESGSSSHSRAPDGCVQSQPISLPWSQSRASCSVYQLHRLLLVVRTALPQHSSVWCALVAIAALWLHGLKDSVGATLDAVRVPLSTGAVIVAVLLLGVARGVRAELAAHTRRLPSPALAHSEIVPPPIACTGLLHAELIDGWLVEKAYNLKQSSLYPGHEMEHRLPIEASIPDTVDFCVDSGATCKCIPAQEMWLFSEILERNPKTKLSVAIDSPALDMVAIGSINCIAQTRARGTEGPRIGVL
mmetsp:Transcript_10847/g.23641  ORF Transcript_10847/g.23641 Transcript_10847/m.23641 type:complete len:254 (+) Transcript_10847:90-851(+)